MRPPRPAWKASPAPWRANWVSRGVTVNAVSPGFIETDMTAEHLPEAQRAALIQQIPLARIGAADDVAGAVAFLAGPEAYISGAVIPGDGGLGMGH